MCVGLLASLFGCSTDPTKHGTWTNISMSCTSSVMSDWYYFSISRDSATGLIASGNFYDGATEYSVENISLSENTARAILDMCPESLPTYKPNSLLSSLVLDGTEHKEIVTHEDGTERRIGLEGEKRREIIELLRSELKSAGESAN